MLRGSVLKPCTCPLECPLSAAPPPSPPKHSDYISPPAPCPCLAPPEGFQSDAGPWSLLAADALVEEEGQYKPDFSAHVGSELLRCLRISKLSFDLIGPVGRPENLLGSDGSTGSTSVADGYAWKRKPGSKRLPFGASPTPQGARSSGNGELPRRSSPSRPSDDGALSGLVSGVSPVVKPAHDLADHPSMHWSAAGAGAGAGAGREAAGQVSGGYQLPTDEPSDPPPSPQSREALDEDRMMP